MSRRRGTKNAMLPDLEETESRRRPDMKSRQCNLSSVFMSFVDSQAFLNEYAVVRFSTPGLGA